MRLTLLKQGNIDRRDGSIFVADGTRNRVSDVWISVHVVLEDEFRIARVPGKGCRAERADSLESIRTMGNSRLGPKPEKITHQSHN